MIQINQNIRIETKGRRRSIQVWKSDGWKEVDSAMNLQDAILASTRRVLTDKTATTEQTAVTLRRIAQLLEETKDLPKTAA